MSEVKRYDTLVIEGACKSEVPREAAGGRVVSWSQGHGLAHSDALEVFVNQVIDGCYPDPDEVVHAAEAALALAEQQRELGYV